MDYKKADERKILIRIISERCDLCGCCVGVCPEDALELSMYQLSIIPERCTNCSKCVWCCPLEALIFNNSSTK